MKKLIYIIFITVITSLSLFATPNKQMIIASDSAIYDYIDLLQIESANLNIIMSRPASIAELESKLHTIQTEKLSKTGLELYKQVESYLNELSHQQEWIQYVPSLKAGLETYLHSEKKAPWQYDYNDRTPLLNFINTFYFSDNLLLHFDLDVRKDIYVTDLDDNYTNLLLDMNHLGSLFPQRAFVTSGGEHWNFTLSKDKNSWGTGQYSNFIISDAAPYHDTIQASFFDQYSKTSFLLMSMSPHYIDSTKTVDDPAYVQEFGDDAGEYPGKYLMAHRTEFSFYDLRLGLSESLLVMNTPLDFRFFNPANIYHNFFMSESATSFVQVDMNLRLFQFINLYYQIGWNQIQTPFENDRYIGASDIPGGMGHILGIRGSYPLSGGYVKANYEFTYMSPWMYINSWDQTISLNYNWSAIVLSNYTGTRRAHFAPLGHSAGNDAIIHLFSMDYVVPFKWQAGFCFLLQYSGENSILTMQERGPDAVLASAPSGIAETKLALTLAGSVHILKELEIYSEGTFVSLTNAGNILSNNMTDFQFVLGVKYSPDFK